MSTTVTSSGPNTEVLEAQMRVCTGPHQSRPLGVKEDDPQPQRILEVILASARGELPPRERVSDAQLGAFFAAMTIRRSFAADTNWNDAEATAFELYDSALRTELPKHIRFLLDGGATEPGAGAYEAIPLLRRILAGAHLSHSETLRLCEEILSDEVPDGLKAAALIGQRMNIETLEEVGAYLEAGHEGNPTPVDATSLTHLGQPFDGSTRYFRPALFVAAVRAVYGNATVLHGVDELPPKRGVTDEQILEELGAQTQISNRAGAALLEDERVGFVYLSQQQYAPQVHALNRLRAHIAKRPVFATTEKAQQLFVNRSGSNHMIVGFYHVGYESKLLNSMRSRGLDSGMVVKGEEGSISYSLRLGKPSTAERRAINYTEGFRTSAANGLEDLTHDVDPAAYGFHYGHNPRVEPVGARAFADAGLAALRGEDAGHVTDRIVFNAAMIDWHLGLCDDVGEALSRSREALASGRALARLETYISSSTAL